MQHNVTTDGEPNRNNAKNVKTEKFNEIIKQNKKTMKLITQQGKCVRPPAIGRVRYDNWTSTTIIPTMRYSPSIQLQVIARAMDLRVLRVGIEYITVVVRWREVYLNDCMCVSCIYIRTYVRTVPNEESVGIELSELFDNKWIFYGSIDRTSLAI